MMLGRTALAHLRHSFQQHGPLQQLETSKSTEHLSTKDIDNNSMSTSSSSGIVEGRYSARRKSVTSRRNSTSTRRSSSVSTIRRFSSTSDDDGVVLIGSDNYFDPNSELLKFDPNSTRSKFDLLHAVRYKVEHREISRASSGEKRRLCSILGDHLRCGDADLILYSAQLVHDVLPHLGEADACMGGHVMPGLVPCLGNSRIAIRKAAVQALQTYLRFTSDIQAVLKSLVHYGLEHHDRQVVLETLVTIPALFHQLEGKNHQQGNNSLFILVSGLAKKLQVEETRLPAFMAMQKVADVVGPKTFAGYLSKLNNEQRKIYEGLSEESPLQVLVGRNFTSNGPQMATGFMEYGAIDDGIVQKLRDDDNIRVRLQGAEELNRAMKSMKDISPLLPQMRPFLNFLDSVFEETNFKLNLLLLEVYAILIDKMRSKVKSHLRTFCVTLLRHASDSKIVVRIENYRVIKKLMVQGKPNTVINHFFEHIGDKRSRVREDILNIVMYALLTFPSYEFDLKNIAATVVPTLVDPKRRVRQASQECVAVLAAFMGPSKAAPLIRSIELLENHFERGSGVLAAVQARLARRQLPRITPDGLVDYSVQIPNSNPRSKSPGGPVGQKYSADIEWILAGTGSVSSGSARSVSTQRSELDESLSSSASFPNSPATTAPPAKSAVSVNGVALQRQRQRDLYRKDLLSLSASTASAYHFRSRSHETLGPSMRVVEDEDDDFSDGFSCDEDEHPGPKRSYTESEISHNNNNNHNIAKDLAAMIGKHVKYSGEAKKRNDSAELPRLIGTKSQASTASSSATRDSGISLNEMQQQQLQQLQQQLLQEQQQLSKNGKQHQNQLQRNGSTRGSLQKLISIDDLPVNGRALPLSTRPGTNRSDDITLVSVGPSRTGSKSNIRAGSESQKSSTAASRQQSISRGSTSRTAKTPTSAANNSNGNNGIIGSNGSNGSNNLPISKSEQQLHVKENGIHNTLDLEFLPSLKSNPRRKSFHCDDVTPPRSPRFPSHIIANGKANNGYSSTQTMLNGKGNNVFTSQITMTGKINNSFESQIITTGKGNNGFASQIITTGKGSVTSSDAGNLLLLRHGENSPFAHQQAPRSTGSTNSTPYSQISVPSSYDYDEDFTSDSESEISTMVIHNRSAQSQRTVGSTSSTTGSSRIPIKRNSSLRRKKDVMNNYNKDSSNDEKKSDDTDERHSSVTIEPESEVDSKFVKNSKIAENIFSIPPKSTPSLKREIPMSKSSKKYVSSPPMKRTAIPPRTLPLRSISHQPATNTTAAAATSTTPNKTTTTGTTPGTFKFLRASSPSKIPTSTKTPDSTRSRRKTAHSSPPPSPKPIRRTVSERRIPTFSASSLQQQQQTPGSSATFSRFSPRKNAQNGSLHNISTVKTPTSIEPIPKTPTSHEPSPNTPISYEPTPKTLTTSNGLSTKTASLNDLSSQTPIANEPTPKNLIQKVPRTPIQEDPVKDQLVVSSSPPSSADIDPADIIPIFSSGSALKHSPILIRKQISMVETSSRPESSPKEFNDSKQNSAKSSARDSAKSVSKENSTKNETKHNSAKSKPEVVKPEMEEDIAEGDENETDHVAVEIDHVAVEPTRTKKSAAATNRQTSVSNSSAKLSLPLKTSVTLKTPIEGSNLGPFHKPEEFIERITNNLASQDWEDNVNGLTGVYRLVQHHPDYLLSEYKQIMQHLMNHVKNLRSQVCRAAVTVVGELFVHLKRNMESDLDKIVITLLNKSGDTNKFLREDCNVALDAIVENVSHVKIIAVVTSPEIAGHKNPVVRATVSRMLAYIVDRMGVTRALSGAKDVTEKLLPAIAKLAQDGNPDARNYSKFTLQRMMNEQPVELEKMLKKHLNSNMLRNLEKVLDALREPNARGGRASGRRGTSRQTL